MRTVLSTVVAASVATALVSASSPAIAAPPLMPGVESPASSPVQAETPQEARDLVAFFLMGSGPLMDSHQGLAAELGITPQDAPADAIHALTEALREADPHLDTTVAEPMTSGDPVLVFRALTTLQPLVAAVADDRAADFEAGVDDGRGWAWNVNSVLTVNVAVAVLIATAVTIALPVLIRAVDGDGQRLDQEVAALKIAEQL